MSSKYKINLERLKEISVNQEFSSKASLYEFLFGMKSDGKIARMYIQQEMERYLKFEKVGTGHKIKITEVFSEPITRKENRGGRNNIKYIQYAEKLILESGSFMRVSWEIFSNIYDIGNREFWKRSEDDTPVIWYFKQTIRDKLNTINDSVFNSLTNQGLIGHELIWVKNEKDRIVELNGKELEIVENLQNEICKELDCTLQDALRNHKKFSKYKKRFEKRIKEYGFNPFKAHKVINTKKYSLPKEEHQESQKLLKEEIAYYIYKQIIESRDKSYQKNKKRRVRGFGQGSKLYLQPFDLKERPDVLGVYCKLFGMKDFGQAEDRYKIRYESEKKPEDTVKEQSDILCAGF